MPERDLRDREQRRRAAGPLALDERAVAGVALEVAPEVGHADADDPARREQAAALGQQVEHGREREVLADVLQEHGLRRPVRKRQAPRQVPVQVGAHADHVDVHPALERVAAGAEVQPERARLLEQPPGLSALERGEQRRPVHLRRLPQLEARDAAEQPCRRAALEAARLRRLALVEIPPDLAHERKLPSARARPRRHRRFPLTGPLAAALPGERARARGGARARSLVVENGSPEETQELVGREFPQARVLTVENRGFAAANNAGLATTDARWALFLNPDTEILDGSLADLVRSLDGRPEIGLAGVRQVDANGTLTPTARRFPTPSRALGDALGSSGCRGARPGSASANCASTRYDREHRDRLDDRLVHARPAGGARRRRRLRRALLPLLGGGRPLPCVCAARAGRSCTCRR